MRNNVNNVPRCRVLFATNKDWTQQNSGYHNNYACCDKYRMDVWIVNERKVRICVLNDRSAANRLLHFRRGRRRRRRRRRSRSKIDKCFDMIFRYLFQWTYLSWATLKVHRWRRISSINLNNKTIAWLPLLPSVSLLWFSSSKELGLMTSWDKVKLMYLAFLDK